MNNPTSAIRLSLKGSFILFNSLLIDRKRRVLGPVKGNNTTGKAGKLICEHCRRRRSQVLPIFSTDINCSVSMMMFRCHVNCVTNEDGSVSKSQDLKPPRATMRSSLVQLPPLVPSVICRCSKTPTSPMPKICILDGIMSVTGI